MGNAAFTEAELSVTRRAYARQMLAASGVQDERVENAFATVRREDFLGSEPWQFVHRPPLPPLPRNDPVAVYQDVVIALQPDRGVNNGSPSLHARMLHDLAVAPGQHVAHIGSGAGYYTAMLAELVGPSGSVSAYEFDAELAARAAVNLKPWPNVTVAAADGAEAPAETTDRIYVNFAVAAPAAAWSDRLKPDGKLLFALGAPHPNARAKFPRHSAQGAAVLIERRPSGYAARWLCPAYYVCAEGRLAGDEASELALFAAFQKGGIEFIKSLRLNEAVDPARCWYWSPRWALSYDALGG
jgi:protein-L-isoaspartate(D-aspartate) O-methyltransferase